MHFFERIRLYVLLLVISLLLVTPIYRMQSEASTLMEMVADPFFQGGIVGVVFLVGGIALAVEFTN